jgi:hypothetical protein
LVLATQEPGNVTGHTTSDASGFQATSGVGAILQV